LYQKAFKELAASIDQGLPFVWANLDIDIVSFGYVDHKDYEAVGALVQRLQISERDSPSCGADHWYSLDLGYFQKVKEIYVICKGGMWTWHYDVDEQYWPCGKENVFMVDPDDGRMIRADEMERIFDQEVDEVEARGDVVLRDCQDSKDLIPFRDVMLGFRA
jgi:hypothetical protein